MAAFTTCLQINMSEVYSFLVFFFSSAESKCLGVLVAIIPFVALFEGH